jgi:hypothetical protein
MQHFHYGRGAFLYRKAQARRTSGQIRFEPLSFYTRLVLYPFSKMKGWRALALTLLLLLSQTANAAGFVWEWFQLTLSGFSQKGGRMSKLESFPPLP